MADPRPTAGDSRAPHFADRLARLVRSRSSRLAFTAALGLVALVIAVVAARHIAEIPWPLSRGNPGLLVAAAVLWLTRAVGLLLLLGALGIGFSFTLALLFLCATSAAAALPVGPGGTATQAGAGAAVLIASGVGVSEAVGVALAIQGMGILVGGSIFLFAAAWRTGQRVTLRFQPATVRTVLVGIAGDVRP